MKISLIIPNYNGSVLLNKNIPRLLKVLDEHIQKTKNSLELIVVDDCSTDESVSTITDLFNVYKTSKVDLTLLTSEKNRGFSSTVNKGASHAKGEILILLNSDAYPEDDFITPFLGYFRDDEKLFGVGFMDKSIEEGKTVLRGRGIGEWKRGFLIHKRGEIDSETTLWVNGGSGAFRRSIWEKLGGMDDIYNPFYWEDIDLSYRALKSGYALRFEKKSVVVHEHEKGAIAKTYTQDQVKTIAYRNQIIFTWTNVTDISLILSHIFWLPIHIFKAIIRGDGNFLNGCIKAFLLFPKVIQSRSRHTSHFRFTDQDVVNIQK